MDSPCPLVQESSRSDGGGHPKLGPWMVTFHVWQPRAPTASVRGRKDQDKHKEGCLESSNPCSSFPPLSSPMYISSPSNSSPDFDSWQKPTKVARHRFPSFDVGDLPKVDSVARIGFSALGLLGDNMDVGGNEEVGLRDVPMADPSFRSLKRVRSSPKLDVPNLPTPIQP